MIKWRCGWSVHCSVKPRDGVSWRSILHDHGEMGGLVYPKFRNPAPSDAVRRQVSPDASRTAASSLPPLRFFPIVGGTRFELNLLAAAGDVDDGGELVSIPA